MLITQRTFGPIHTGRTPGLFHTGVPSYRYVDQETRPLDFNLPTLSETPAVPKPPEATSQGLSHAAARFAPDHEAFSPIVPVAPGPHEPDLASTLEAALNPTSSLRIIHPLVGEIRDRSQGIHKTTIDVYDRSRKKILASVDLSEYMTEKGVALRVFVDFGRDDRGVLLGGLDAAIMASVLRLVRSHQYASFSISTQGLSLIEYTRSHYQMALGSVEQQGISPEGTYRLRYGGGYHHREKNLAAKVLRLYEIWSRTNEGRAFLSSPEGLRYKERAHDYPPAFIRTFSHLSLVRDEEVSDKQIERIEGRAQEKWQRFVARQSEIRRTRQHASVDLSEILKNRDRLMALIVPSSTVTSPLARLRSLEGIVTLMKSSPPRSVYDYLEIARSLLHDKRDLEAILILDELLVRYTQGVASKGDPETGRLITRLHRAVAERWLKVEREKDFSVFFDNLNSDEAAVTFSLYTGMRFDTQELYELLCGLGKDNVFINHQLKEDDHGGVVLEVMAQGRNEYAGKVVIHIQRDQHHATATFSIRENTVRKIHPNPQDTRSAPALEMFLTVFLREVVGLAEGSSMVS